MVPETLRVGRKRGRLFFRGPGTHRPTRSYKNKKWALAHFGNLNPNNGLYHKWQTPWRYGRASECRDRPDNEVVTLGVDDGAGEGITWRIR